MYITRSNITSYQSYYHNDHYGNNTKSNFLVKANALSEKKSNPFNINFKGLIIGSERFVKFNNVDKTENRDSLDNKMKKVLSKVKYSSVYDDHDGAIKTLTKAKTEKTISLQNPVTLLHFDTHSDIKKNNEPVLHIGNWINKAMSMGVIGEIYWILPDWTKDNEWKSSFWPENALWSQDNEGIANIMLDAPSEKVFYYEKNNGKIHFLKPLNYDFNMNNYFPVRFHKLTIDDLPSMKDRQNVMLDICGDYFVNSGMSTVNKANNLTNFKENAFEIDRSFNEIFTQLEKKDIQPTIYTAAKSEGFVPTEHLSQVSSCLNKINNVAKDLKTSQYMSLII